MENMEFWHWLIIGVVFLILEVFAPGAIFMWFGFSGLLTGLFTWLFPSMEIGAQILLFSASAVLSILVWRMVRKNTPEPESPDPELNNRLTSFIGQEYVLTLPIKNGRGRMQIGDGSWTVQGPDLPSGSRVRITDVKGIHLIVEAI